MALAPAKLSEIAYIASSAGSVYTNPAATTSYVKSLLIHNTNTTTEAIVINRVPNSGGSLGTAASSNRIFNFNLVANDTIEIKFEGPGQVLTATNDAIFASTTTASKVTITVMGFTA